MSEATVTISFSVFAYRIAQKYINNKPETLWLCENTFHCVSFRHNFSADIFANIFL